MSVKTIRSSRLAAGPDSQVILVGGGIASMAAALFLIRDGDVPGDRISIFEETDSIGGSLDAAGSARTGYVMRGGRMLENKYSCTFDMFSSVPTLDDTQTVTEEIMAWNKTLKTSSKSRLFRDGQRQTGPLFGLSENHILNIERLAIEPEFMLNNTTIADQFDADFFGTDFWFMWCTTFAFQPWHSAVEFKRYLVRFVHMVDGFERLQGILRTVYNQYDSLVRPLHKWLEARGVRFVMDTRVTALGFKDDADEYRICDITYERLGEPGELTIAENDLVMVTLGSMTDSSSLGSMTKAPVQLKSPVGGAWSLWQSLAAGRPELGNPSAFDDHVDESKWVSFTTTLREPNFLRKVMELTGNAPGEGGLISFPQSNWLMSIVIPHQPHFIGQPENVSVFWGYGLSVDKLGDFIAKPMCACTGEEILIELLGHLHIRSEAATILQTSTCIPCFMPYITSQFLRRNSGDRPQVIPKGSQNLALIGQFCEMPHDVVFTVEYSIRSAQTAVNGLLGLHKLPPPVYHGEYDPRMLLKAFRALHDVRH